MTEPDSQSASSPEEIESEKFYSGAFARIVRMMVVIAVFATAGAWARWGHRVGLGLAVGCGIAGVNFLWLKRSVSAFADRMTKPEAERPSGISAAGFVLRYCVLVAVGYVIFKSSIVSLSGVMAGLFLPVAAILLEAMYETYVALRRGL